MKLVKVVCVLLVLLAYVRAQDQGDFDENEFAEFDDEFDEEEFTKDDPPPPAQKPEVIVEAEDDEDAVVEDEADSDFEHYDEDEFEGVSGEPRPKRGREEPQINIVKVPVLMHTSWESFYLEILLITGLAVYFLNYMNGKNKNHKLAQAWLNSHRQLLEDNFALVGDDGSVENETPGLMKESENVYTLWCSGRVCCEGMLVELKFIKRQDLVGVLWQLMRPGSDQLRIKVQMNKDDMESFVLCLAAKKTAVKMSKDMTDLSTYCGEKKSAEKWGLPSNLTLMTEIGEVASSLFDQRVCTVINKYNSAIDYLHFSDQYSGPKQPDDGSQSQPTTKPTEVKRVLLFGFNIPNKGHVTPEAMEGMRPLLQLVFYMIDRVRKLRLSKEAKSKAEKNRSKVEEAYLKSTHAARAEQAAAKREEKRRQEKERIMNENDPEKQRKWEEKEAKRQMKKRAPKIKQLKVKGL